MIIPFENHTGSLEKKLADRNRKADKRSRHFLVFTIAIAVCMALSINLLSAETAEDFKNTQRGKAQVTVVAVTDEQLSGLEENEQVTWVGEYALLGVFYQGVKSITPTYGNEVYFRNQQDTPFQGTIPVEKDEIMLPRNYMDFLGESYEVGDTAVLDLTGTGSTGEYTVTAILEDTEESKGYQIYVGKELAKELAGSTFQETAYVRLDTEEILSGRILDVMKDVAKSADIEDGQVFLTDYFAVMTGVVQNGMPLPIPLIVLVTAVLAAMIVKGIFYAKIVKNVQMFGQLRTIGMTKRQIRRMARKEGLRYAMEGIPLGILCGVLVGLIGCPGGFRVRTTLIYACAAAVMSFFMVNAAIFQPVRVAMNISPVEGTRYHSNAGHEKKRFRRRRKENIAANADESCRLHRRLTPENLAVINIGRNRRKAAFTCIMLGLSGAVLLTTATAAGSIDARKQAAFNYYPEGTIEVSIKSRQGSTFDQQTDDFGSSRLQMEDNPLSNGELIRKLEAVEGVEKVTPAKCVYMMVASPVKANGIMSNAMDFPTLDQEELESREPVLSAGTADYDRMAEENGIWVEEGFAGLGDQMELSGRAPDGSTFQTKAVVAGTYKIGELMEKAPVVPGGPRVVMTYDMVKKLTGITDQTGRLAIQVSEDHFETALSEIEKIAEENGTLTVNSISQTIRNIELIYGASIKTYYIISVILFVFGGISLMNMLMVDFQTRKREFGLLQAVGTTRKQLRIMLKREIRIYLSASLAVALVCGGIGSAAVCGYLDKENHCISLSLPWVFLAGLAGVLIVIYFIFAAYAGNELKNTSILAAVREE